MLNCRVVSWKEFLSEVRKYASPSQMRIMPDDAPGVISKTNLEPIYHDGCDPARLPEPRILAELYLDKLNLLSTAWQSQAAGVPEVKS